jgi:putative transposase
MTISKEVLDALLNGVRNADDLLGDQGLMKEFKVRLMKRMFGSELPEHLGYEPDTQPTNEQSHRRNGTSRKTLKGNDGALPIDVPRDRECSFELELIKKARPESTAWLTRSLASIQPDYRPATFVLTSKRSMV